MDHNVTIGASHVGFLPAWVNALYEPFFNFHYHSDWHSLTISHYTSLDNLLIVYYSSLK